MEEAPRTSRFCAWACVLLLRWSLEPAAGQGLPLSLSIVVPHPPFPLAISLLELVERRVLVGEVGDEVLRVEGLPETLHEQLVHARVDAAVVVHLHPQPLLEGRELPRCDELVHVGQATPQVAQLSEAMQSKVQGGKKLRFKKENIQLLTET